MKRFFSALFRSPAPARRFTRPDRGKRRWRTTGPEPLEARSLLANFLVTDLSDNVNDPGSLAHAVLVADVVPGSTINFKPGLTGTISLSSGLRLSAPMTINGPGAGLLAIRGGGPQSRFSDIAVTARNVAISGLTITGGNAGASQVGGGIVLAAGSLRLSGCVLSNNTAGAGGGIMVLSGSLAMANCVVSNNSATNGGGVATEQFVNVRMTGCKILDNHINALGIEGGGIDNRGTMTLTNCTVSGNTSKTSGGGIGSLTGSLTLTNSSVAGNSGMAGGGIYVFSGTASLAGTTVSGNTATVRGGGIAIASGSFTLRRSVVATNFLNGSPGVPFSNITGTVNPASAFNIIGAGGSGGLKNGVNGNIVIGGSSGGFTTPPPGGPPIAPVSIAPIDRLAIYDPSATNEYFGPVKPNDPRLVGKDVYVLVHGYAPGYRDWVTNAASAGIVLKWWQTIPDNYVGGTKNQNYINIRKLAGTKPGDASGPMSPWLLDGHSVGSGNSKFTVSGNGLAEDILASDPNAVVLAYSWLDDSATSAAMVTIKGISFQIPLEAYKSEALTTLNGERLAAGLELALGTQAHFGGQLQLIGHSHGSKVATVATDALIHNTADPLAVNQLTILDSPESDSGPALGTVGFALAQLRATNDNWYFLQDLNISENPAAAQTFVDNYISALDEPYDLISYPGSSSVLGNVLDTHLIPWPDLFNDPADVHSYAAYWYAGSSEPARTFGHEVGREWSVLLGNNRTAPPFWNYQLQNWLTYKNNAAAQYRLIPWFGLPNHPAFDGVTLSPTRKTPGVVVANNDPKLGTYVTLTQQNSTTQTAQATFTTARHWFSGLTFNYQFTKFTPGDTLSVSVYDPIGKKWDLAFVMDPTLVSSQPQPLKGTISLGSYSISNFTMRVTLTSLQPNSSSSVTISHLSQYANT